MKVIRFMVLGLLLGHCLTAKVQALDGAHDFGGLIADPCGACHSVHNAVGGSSLSSNDVPAITSVYNSPTMDHSILVDTVNNCDAPLCLACHDGAFARANVSVDIADIIEGNVSDITTDLSNDHPVGFIYDASLDDEIKEPTDEHVHVTFGPGYNEMWCSTCHNVHNNTYPPFLNMPNDGSALCFECHIK
ncbi:cytochrome c3 family protein [Deltaproteobacteria bacterium IMCC39524]|nr:cytochrome c3 family protein [Deltaproteobacteria bacterium IMCC39524]